MAIKTVNLAKLCFRIVVMIQIFLFGAGFSEGDKFCSCYTYVNNSFMVWSKAAKSCQFNDKHLVVMETVREWEYIKKEIQTRQSGPNDEWLIGLYRNLSTGKWTWVNGKPLSFDKWQNEKPKKGDFYALIAKEFPKGFKGSFNSIKGNVYRGWICEEETDNCGGDCFSHIPIATNSTPPVTTTLSTQEQRTISTAYSSTTASGTSPGDERCSCYTFENDRLVSWPLAMASCKQINKDLVVIETQREWKFLTMKIQTRKSGKHDEWHIGLYKSSLTGNWTWINGKALTIDKWQKNTPNDNNSYTLMAKEWPTGFKGSFKTITESTTRGWICEEVTDNCQGVCLSDDSSVTSPLALASSTESTASHATRDSEEGKQAYEKDNCSLSVTILASLVAVLTVALLIFGVCFLSWRKKQRKDTKKATDTGNELDNQDESLLSAETAARQLGFSDEAKPHGIELEYQRRGTAQDSRQECEYAMLTPRTMMVPGDSSYASLVKSKQGDCTNTSSVAASPLPQQDAEPHDELPTYINVHSPEHI